MSDCKNVRTYTFSKHEVAAALSAYFGIELDGKADEVIVIGWHNEDATENTALLADHDEMVTFQQT